MNHCGKSEWGLGNAVHLTSKSSAAATPTALMTMNSRLSRIMPVASTRTAVDPVFRLCPRAVYESPAAFLDRVRAHSKSLLILSIVCSG